MAIKHNDIFTPQGILEEVENNPNLDFLMNVFNIPRVFGVSGFGGNWNVGIHSFATALLALYWSKHNNYPPEKRNQLVTMALTHDLHESVTGDILPMFKTEELKEKLDKIQDNILNALQVTYEPTLKTDLKIIDLLAFYYEIKQVSPNILHTKKLALANKIADRQLETIFKYCRDNNIAKEKVTTFISSLEI